MPDGSTYEVKIAGGTDSTDSILSDILTLLQGWSASGSITNNYTDTTNNLVKGSVGGQGSSSTTTNYND